jgi:hypothetical protein
VSPKNVRAVEDPPLKQLIARTANRKAVFIEQFSNLANQQHFVMLIVTTVTTTLHGPKLGELLLPIAQDMRLYGTKITDLTNREIPLGRYGRKGHVNGTRFHGRTDSSCSI